MSDHAGGQRGVQVENGDLVRSGSPCTGSKGWYTRDGRLRGSEQPMLGRCGRKLRGTDPARYCKRYPLAGRTACRQCGGASLRGPHHPSSKHGRFWRDIPNDLRRAYANAEKNDALLCLRSDIALLEAKQQQLLGQLAKMEAPSWDEVVEAVDQFKMAKTGEARKHA